MAEDVTTLLREIQRHIQDNDCGKERPEGLAASALVVIFFHLVGLFFIRWTAYPQPLYLTIQLAGIMYAAFGAVVWFYWQGRNWARWLVMAQEIIPSLADLAWPSRRPLAIEILQGGFGLFMLYWLNTKKVRGFFSKLNLPFGNRLR